MDSDSDKPEDEFVQFVCFKIEGKLPVELFQNTWIPVAEKLFSRGINTVILSEKLPFRSDTSPYKFISKNCWESIEAIKGTFPRGVPPPNSRGNVSVNQVIYKLVLLWEKPENKLSTSHLLKLPYWEIQFFQSFINRNKTSSRCLG